MARSGRPNRHLALLGSSLLLPLSLFCFLICVWRWCYELAWTPEFLVVDGVLSHWQVWCFGGVALHVLAVRLGRYGEPARRRAGVKTAAPAQPARVEPPLSAGSYEKEPPGEAA